MSWIQAVRRRAAPTVKLLPIVALLLPALAEPLGAQSCNNADLQPEVNESNQRRQSSGGGFCNNGITGSESCGGDVGKIQFELRLAGRQDIDLVCTSSDGLICIMPNNCQDPVLHERISENRVRLTGNFTSRDLKILIADDALDNGTLCLSGIVIDVTCAGSFGGNMLLDSPFEQAYDTEGWEIGSCGGCNFFAGTLTAGASSFTHLEGYDVSRPGVHRAQLLVPEGADFDLVLWQRIGGEWVQVAESETEAALERVQFEGPPGVYRWEIRALSGGGFWELKTEFPGGKEVDREE